MTDGLASASRRAASAPLPGEPLLGERSTGSVPLNVFVHLARDKDLDKWREAHAAGTLVGTNDETPYGYGRAERMNCRVTFSRSQPETALGKLARLGIRFVTGFDLLHAWHQRAALQSADVVWTHTESQFLAVAAVLGSGPRPKIIGQSVWLFDRWPTLSAVHRAFYRRLMKRVDVLTVHSPDNLRVVQTLFPDKRSEVVPFGIPAEQVRPPVPRSASPIRILAPGSDKHRDWATLVEAVRGRQDMDLLILSGTADPRLAKGMANVKIALARSNDELLEALAGATLVCVPLHPNKHASGITVIQEAVLAGVPVVCSDTGGLSSYFGPSEVAFVPPGDPAALRSALLQTAANPDAAAMRAARAQIRMAMSGLGAEAYVRRHVEISREIVRP